MSSCSDKFEELMSKYGIKLSEDISKDGQLHKIDVTTQKETEKWWYMFDPKKPAVGLLGRCNSDEIIEWRFKKKDPKEKAAQSVKIKAMKIFCKETLSIAETDNSEFPSAIAAIEIAGQPESMPVEIDTTTVARLSALLPFDYDRVRKDEAIRLSVRVSTLDKAVVKERKYSITMKSIGPQLLSDLLEIFISMDAEEIRSEEIVSALCADSNKVWAMYNRGENIAFNQLAYVLSLYGVTPINKRFSSGVFKAYSKESIFAAYTRNVAAMQKET